MGKKTLKSVSVPSAYLEVFLRQLKIHEGKGPNFNIRGTATDLKILHKNHLFSLVQKYGEKYLAEGAFMCIVMIRNVY